MPKFFTKLMRQTAHYRIHDYNFRIILYILALSTISVLSIHSAADGYVCKQIAGIALGFVILIFFSLISYNFIANFRWILYIINIAILLLVLFAGISVNGSRRWFSLGAFGTFQPSELAKILMIVFLSKFIYDNQERLNRFKFLLITGILFFLPVALILKEPDLSTAIVFIFIFCALLFIGGLKWKIIAGALAVIIPAGGFLLWYILQPFQILLKDYQQARIMTFLNPSKFLTTTYTQQYNSVMAIGSGMISGKGFSDSALFSVQGKSFISEPQTDFIFAVIGEEFGFIGSVAVIALLFALAAECLIIAKNAPDLCGRLIASGVAAMLVIQTFINIGVATAILPNTGLVLPFVSYGLSALLCSMMGLGLVLNVGLQRNRR